MATQDRQIWHMFFGTPGSLNDLNVLDRSPLFEDTLHMKSPQVSFKINGNHYHYGYYLVDGIYNNYSTMIKGKSHSEDQASKTFTKAQEAAQKDFECAFALLKGKFHIIERPGRSWSQSCLESIILCCIILHNMLIDEAKEPRPPPTTIPFDTQVIPPDPHRTPLTHTEIQFWRMDMQSELKHAFLMEDLVSLHWARRATRREETPASNPSSNDSSVGSSDESLDETFEASDSSEPE